MALLPQLTPQPWQYGQPDPVLTQSQILALGLATGAKAGSTIGVAGTIYIAIRPDGLVGSGTALDPYGAGTAAALDVLFPTIPAFTRIYFGPGTFLTATGVLLKDGQMIDGAGIDVTFIKLAANSFVGSGQVIGVIANASLAADYTFASVRNVTVDCNLTNQSGVTGVSTGFIDAVALLTVNGLIEDVKVLGYYANGAEGFPIKVWSSFVGTKTALNPAIAHIRRVEYVGNGSSGTGFTNASIISCFDQTSPDGTSFTNQWMTGSITECTVVNQPGVIAFGSGGWNGFVIANNKTQNVGTFMVQDTHKGWNVTVQDNVCEDFGGNSSVLAQFFALVNGNAANQYKNYKFLRNTSRAKSGAVQPTHFKIASPDITDFLIEGHVADANGFNAAGNQGWLFNVNVLDGMIRNCRVSPTYTIGSGVANSIINIKYENNTCFDGTPLSDVTAGYAQRGAPFLFVKSLLGVNLKTVANTAIFTVPAGETYCLVDLIVVPTTTTALTVAATYAASRSSDSAAMFASTSTGNTLIVGFLDTGVRAASAAGMATCPAGANVQFAVTAGATATTFTANVYAVGFYL